MDGTQFAFWLKGFFEISNEDGQQLSAQQVQIIKDHLALVFKKETPVYQGTKTRVAVADGYGQDFGGIKLTNIKLPTYGDQYGPPCYTGIDEMERANSWVNANNDSSYFNLFGIKDLGYGFTNSNKGLSGIWRAKTLEDIEWEKKNSGPVVVNPNTPVEITTTPFVQWDGIQVSC